MYSFPAAPSTSSATQAASCWSSSRFSLAKSWTKATSRGWMTTTPAAEFRTLRQSAMRLGRLLLYGAAAALAACALPAAGRAADGLRAPQPPAPHQHGRASVGERVWQAV